MREKEEVKETPEGPTVVENSNCLSNGEDGREEPKVYSNPHDNLNFGWFSLPRDDQNAGGSKRESRPPSRPSSKHGARPAQPYQPQNGGTQQQHPDWNNGQKPQTGAPRHGGSETYLPPPSRQGYAQQQSGQQQYQQQQQQQQQQPGDSQRFVVSDDPEIADFEHSGHQQQQEQQRQMAWSGLGHGDNPNAQGASMREIEFVDWPLSRTAQEMLMRQRHPPAEPNYAYMDKQRPPSRGNSPNVRNIPPTPMPPLQWNGYAGSNRPTYATWREHWHRQHAQPHSQGQAYHQTGRHQREQPQRVYSDYNNNNNDNSANADTNESSPITPSPEVVAESNENNSANADTNGNSPIAPSPEVVAESNKNNNNDSKYIVKMDRLDLGDNQGGSYWNRHWSEDHVTNISDEFIGYGGSIFRSLKSSKQQRPTAAVRKSPTITVKSKDGYEAISFPSKADKNSSWAKKKFITMCRRHLKKWASPGDPIVQANRNASQTSSRIKMGAKCSGSDFMKGGQPKYAKPVYKKTPFSLNFHTSLDNIKQTAVLWAKKIRRGSHRNDYSHFENDY